MVTPVSGLVAEMISKMPPSTMMGVFWAAFSLDWTGKMESSLTPMFSTTLAGRTVSWAPVSAVPWSDLVLLMTLLLDLGMLRPRAA